MKYVFPALLLLLSSCAPTEDPATETAGNPIVEGWYADPEGAVFGDRYFVFPTFSARYNDQLFFDAFSSPDLVNWTKHERILDTTAVKWAWRDWCWTPTHRPAMA